MARRLNAVGTCLEGVVYEIVAYYFHGDEGLFLRTVKAMPLQINLSKLMVLMSIVHPMTLASAAQVSEFQSMCDDALEELERAPSIPTFSLEDDGTLTL